jgi:hypothetical protein
MTISITVSVNGNYKVPVKVQYEDGRESVEVISGRGHDGPFVKHVSHYHGPSKVTTVIVGPEEQDLGDDA